MTRPIYVTRPKDPADVAHIPGLDFGPAISLPGEAILTISDAAVRIYLADRDWNRTTDVTGAMLVVGSVGVSNNVVAFRVAGGSDNKDYLAVVQPTTSAGRIESMEVLIPVRARAK